MVAFGGIATSLVTAGVEELKHFDKREQIFIHGAESAEQACFKISLSFFPW